MRATLLSLALATLPILAAEPHVVVLPHNAEKFTPETHTQSIAVVNDRDNIRRVPITQLESKWHQSGGMHGITGAVSEKFRTLPAEPKVWIGTIQVKNSLGYMQPNRGMKREYPDGSRFDDVLSYQGVVFEHRTAEKVDGKWKRRVAYSNEAARPPGYTGLKMTCAECHSEAGTGKYGVGLVPGGDGVISDPMPWQLARPYQRY